MGTITIDNHRVEFTDEKNILDIIRKSGVELPTFCYYSELSTYGACRMCVVEDKWGNIMASCSETPKDGMVIYTNTPKLQKHRKMILELLLASHCRDCTTCAKSGKCKLQDLASRFGIKQVRFEQDKWDMPIDDSSTSIVRNPSKCILCGDCVRMCSEIQGMGVLDFAYRGSKMQVMPAFDRKIKDSGCVNCGQCTAVCPTGALMLKDETDRVWRKLHNPNMRVVAQIAPAVRVALGEEFDIPLGENVTGKIVAALRKLGFDEIYDTSLAADLTVMEETKEFLERLDKNEETMPLFTSCCPAWVRFVELKHPELLPHVSTCRSPQQMFGAVVKEYFRRTKETDGKETMMVSIMPCTAKKYECARPEFTTNGEKDVDVVITTQELASMIKEAGIVFSELEPEAPDMPFGLASGSGVLFGVTGGVTEAVLRRCVEERTQESLKDLAFSGVRGMEGIKEAEVKIGERTLKVAVVHGLRHVEELLTLIKSGEKHYDFVEVMACQGGCIGGAGQPIPVKTTTKKSRASGIYKADKSSQIKRSDENPLVQGLYLTLLKDKSHELLHCSHEINKSK